MIRFYSFILAVISCVSCSKEKTKKTINQPLVKIQNTSLVVLGTVQDAGAPQIGCTKKCCATLFTKPSINKKVVSLGLIDSKNNKTYLFEATPDIAFQTKKIASYRNKNDKKLVDGIFLTHAHIGHYAGLMYLGKEAIDAKNTPVYAMPRMKRFLSNNGPWSQLVKRQNIELKELQNQQTINLTATIKVTPFLVPHRDEYSETVGYKIEGPNKSALFIPDIDKWDKWSKDIIAEIQQVDYAFLDATFFSGKEINSRNINEIPHPFIIESIEKFKNLNKKEKNKIIFIHFNHTNPVLNPSSKETELLLAKGFKIARINAVFEL